LFCLSPGVRRLVLTPDGKRVMAAICLDGVRGAVVAWEMESGQVLWKQTELSNPVGVTPWGTNGTLLVADRTTGRLSRLDPAGRLTPIREGIAGQAVALSVVGETAYLLEGPAAPTRFSPFSDNRRRHRPISRLTALQLVLGERRTLWEAAGAPVAIASRPSHG